MQRDELRSFLSEITADRLALIQRHEASARVVSHYDFNNAYQYVIAREETHLGWLQAALSEIAPPVLPSGRLAGTLAYYHVLTGDYRRAARLARSGIHGAGSRVEAAQAWCALAVAKAGAWESRAAEDALHHARELAPNWPRIRHAEERVHMLMPTLV